MLANDPEIEKQVDEKSRFVVLEGGNNIKKMNDLKGVRESLLKSEPPQMKDFRAFEQEFAAEIEMKKHWADIVDDGLKSQEENDADKKKKTRGNYLLSIASALLAVLLIACIIAISMILLIQ